MSLDDQVIRFSLDAVPEPHKREALTEVFGRGVVNMDFQSLTEWPRFEIELHLLPQVAVAWGWNSPHLGKSGHDRSLESDDLMLSWARRPVAGQITHCGRELCGDGSAALFTCAEPMIGQTGGDFHYANIRVSRNALAGLVDSPEDLLMRPIAPSNEALRLLEQYLRILRRGGEFKSAEVAQAASLHIIDLTALAVGATRDGREIARQRGLRAARLEAVKRWALERLGNPGLSVTEVALAHRITPRYVQMLFEAVGSSFTAWLRGERLALARRRLSDPGQSHRTIASIAFDCGFSDLSWFNHAYRRAFGESPSDTRHHAADPTRH